MPPLISTAAAPVVVRVMPTDEELMIAKTAFRIAGTDPGVSVGELR
jgi:acetate kinase